MDVIVAVTLCWVPREYKMFVMVELANGDVEDVWSYFPDENDWSAWDFTEAKWVGETLTNMKDRLRARDVAKIRSWV